MVIHPQGSQLGLLDMAASSSRKGRKKAARPHEDEARKSPMVTFCWSVESQDQPRFKEGKIGLLLGRLEA